MAIRSSIQRLGIAAFALSAISGAYAAPVAPQAAKPAGKPAPPAANAPLTRAVFTQRLDGQFREIDKDGNGIVTTAELSAAEDRLVNNQVAAESKRATQRFQQLDSNHDGQLSLAEFTAPIGHRKGPDATASLARLDANKDGKLSRDEYVMRPLANFDRLDANHDGTLSVAERVPAGRR